MQLAAIAIGILLGIASGLLPGIHSNTVASVLSTLPFPPEYFGLLIAAVLGAHLVFQFFPSVFLSIPDDTVVATVLPGHRMALEGRGREAIAVCASSVMIASAASALLIPLSLAAMPLLYSAIEPHIGPLLVIASIILLASERHWKKIAVAFFVFVLAGLLGIASMRAGINDPLFPAFSGLFAASGILLSFTSQKKIPKQGEAGTKLDYLPYIGAGVVLGMLSDLLPGLAAPAQIAVFASAFMNMDDARKFLALVASIAASHSVSAFASLVSIGKAREGAIAVLDSVKPVMASDIAPLVGAFLLSVGVSAYLLLKISKRTDAFGKIDMKTLNLGVLGYLVAAVLVISGAEGLLLFATATAVGLLPPLLDIRRTHVMGLIIVPSILLAL